MLNAAIKHNIRVSADFIYGLPGDTVQDVANMCRDINTLGLQHCSMYELTIEPDTPLGKSNPIMPLNNDMAEMYNVIDETLTLPRYEVSNYAATGQECRHNLNIWDGAPYIGIGRGAAGRILIDDIWYEQMGGGELFNPLDNDARATERIITGMRTIRGVKLDKITTPAINMEFVVHNPDLVVRTTDNRIAATKRGMLILDDLVLKLRR